MLRLANSILKSSINFNVKSTNLGIFSPKAWNTNLFSATWFSLHSADDRRPKQPLNAFMVFLQEQRPTMKISGKPSETVKFVASKWKEMSETDKKPYKNKQKVLQEQYRAECASYKALLSIEEKKSLLEDFREKKKMKHRKSHKKQVRHSGSPKRNRSAYSIYVSARFSTVKVRTWSEIMELMKDASSTWKTMFTHQKQPYIDEAAKDKERYDKEMEEYIERMKIEEKIHLLPVKYQKQIKIQGRKQRAKKS
uniref:transcription factor A, mitochondrial-like n=1 Tax=Styela clava TaxID=7725 RepID=UPI001939DA46|nr:transcription factor A, mitochondrial-like [Styela clava]